MVFSGGGSDTQSASTSQYGIINVDISSTPLVQGTTVKDHIVFNCNVQFYNCTKSTLSFLLNELQNEIITKVDYLLMTLNGQVNDGLPANIPISTTGLGTINLAIQPTKLIQGTSREDEIVFRVELLLNSYNRPQLVKVLNNLNNEILDKINDIL